LGVFILFQGDSMAFAGIFPGQGSQSIGMLAELAESSSTVKQTFTEASDILGFDLWQMVQTGTNSELGKTTNTQPIMLSAGVAVWRVWQERGGCLPIAFAGHSLGEYTALVANETLQFIDAMTLVKTRAELMQQAVPEGEGAMAAILGLDNESIISICTQIADDSGQCVQAVNFNSVGQVVIAGNSSAVDLATVALKEAGAKRAIKLPVSVPSHCDLMQEAADKLQVKLTETAFSVSLSSLHVLHNVDARSRHSADEIRLALSQQLFKPVRWVDTVQHLKAGYVSDAMIEFGPGKVLFGLNRRIDRNIKTICVHDSASLETALQFCEDNS